MTTHIRPDAGTYIIESDSDIDLNNPNGIDAALFVKGGEYVQGHLYVGGTLVVNGDVISLGNEGGTLALNSGIISDLSPAVTDLYNLGSASHYWKNIFVETLNLTASPELVASAINISSSISHIDAATSATVTLPDGAPGQIKTLVAIANPGQPSVIVIPTSANGFSTITFTSSGDCVTLLYTDSKWNIVSAFRASIT